MSLRRVVQGAVVAFFALSAAATPPEFSVPETAYSGLRWRLVGPFRAGWSTCAAGVPNEPNTFYFGAADGGVWRTADAGGTWVSLFDREPVASVGALAIAASDPGVLYVGTGQVSPRWDITSGNGIYGTRDGGKTWRHLGLNESHHIGRILVDSRNPDVAIVAALGHIFGANEQRGVFRTADGGRNWQRVLYKDANTGAVDLASDPAFPKIVYAALWQVRCHPWQAYFSPMAGPGSGIYKSVDGGITWAPVSAEGLPPGPLGRIGLALGLGTRGMQVYAVISAESRSGLYRSDDGGATWQRVNSDASLANWYFGRITVDPRDPNTLYVMGRSVRRSTDGGKTFTVVKGAPGGDDYHFLWIDPTDPRRMILASDQGTTITVNGGSSWSSWYNQPTGQFYHVATDNRFPYWIYSGQQDSGTVAAASRGDYGRLTFRDWHPVGGDERDYDVPDPTNPEIVYGSGLGGRLSRWDARTGQVQNVSPWPVSSYGARPTSVRYRYDWITPLAISAQEPHSLYFGAQVLFRSDDEGRTWQTISPDLTGFVEGTRGCAGSVTLEQARDCGYGVIFAIAPSPAAKDEIWVGTDDGLVRLTRDGGKIWRNVTPPGLPIWSKIAQIDASASDPATAYVAVDCHRKDDYGPHAFRTHDYGRTWIEIGHGLPENGYVNVVRQDTAGLLFAGTNRGAYVSFDDGDHWQRLQFNLPATGVNDLAIHGSDLIAATQGRALWVLDDISPLRALAGAGILEAGACLFPPAPSLRVRQNENRDTPLPPDEPTAPDPPEGAVIDYYFAKAPAEPVVLEIRDSRNELVRRFRSDEIPPGRPADLYFADLWLRQPDPLLSARAGHNRFVWNLRYPRPPAIRYEYSIAAVPGHTPILPQGALVLPGEYEVRLTVDGKSYSRSLSVLMDPRVQVSPSDLSDQLGFERRTADALKQATVAFQEAAAVQKRLDEIGAEAKGKRDRAEIVSAAKQVSEKLRQFRERDSPDSFAQISQVLASLETDVEDVDRAPTTPQRDVLDSYKKRLAAALESWRRFKSEPLTDFDRRIRAAGLTPVPLK